MAARIWTHPIPYLACLLLFLFACFLAGHMLKNYYYRQAGPMIQIIDTTNCNTLREFHCGESSAATVAFHPQNHVIAIGDDTGEISIFSVPGAKLLGRAHVCSKSAESAAFFHNRRYLATGIADGIIRIFTCNMKCVKDPKSNCGGVSSLAISADDNVIAARYETVQIVVLSVKTGQPIRSWKAQIGSVTSIVYSDPKEVVLAIEH